MQQSALSSNDNEFKEHVYRFCPRFAVIVRKYSTVFANPRYVQHPTNAHMPALPPHPPFQYPRRIVTAWNIPANAPAPAKDPNNDNGVCDCCHC